MSLSRGLTRSLRSIARISRNSTLTGGRKCAVRIGATGFHSIVESHRASNFSHSSYSRINVRHFSEGVITVDLESLGDSISTAVLLQWQKEPGDSIKEDDVIAVVETDKVTMDIRAKSSGVFIEGLAEAQAEVTVGSPLYKMDTTVKEQPVNAESTLGNSPPPPKEAKKADATIVPVPIMGESITTGVLASWEVKAGDSVGIDQVVAVIETDKVNVEVRSPQNGTIQEMFADEGAEINVDAPLYSIVAGDAPPAAAAKKEPSTPPPKQEKESKPTPAPTPAAPAPPKSTPPPSSSGPSKGGGDSGDRTETRVKMTRMRMRISQRLKEAQNTAAMLTTFQEVDMGNLIELRSKYKDEFEKSHGVKLGFMSAFVRACTAALMETPAVNAVIDDTTNELVYRNYVDVSVAVASPNGLVVPVLRNTEKMSFSDVEKTIGMFGKKAKEGTLALEDMAGGTFTISNGGVFGSLFGTPIINPPQSAILGMHATKMRAVVINGKVEVRPMMYLALTYDHRMIDGREAVTFLKSVASKIEDPGRLLLTL